MAGRAAFSASGSSDEGPSDEGPSDDDPHCYLLTLSHDALVVLFERLADPLHPAAAVAFSSASKGLRTPPALQVAQFMLARRHWRAAALCRQIGMSCVELREVVLMDWRILAVGHLETLSMIMRTNGLPRLLTFDFTDYLIGDAGMHALCSGLDTGAAPFVAYLYLGGSGFGLSGATAFAAALQRGAMRRLETLSLFAIPLGSAGVAVLAAVLRKLPVLTSLDLEETDLGDEGVASLVADLGEDDFKALEHIDLDSNRLTIVSGTVIASAIGGSALPRLRSVRFDDLANKAMVDGAVQARQIVMAGASRSGPELHNTLPDTREQVLACLVIQQAWCRHEAALRARLVAQRELLQQVRGRIEMDLEASGDGCRLLELSHDALGMLFDKLADLTQPIIAVALSSTCKALRTPLRAALHVLKEGHEKAVALCLKASQTHCLEGSDVTWNSSEYVEQLNTSDMAILGKLVQWMPRLQTMLIYSSQFGDEGMHALCEGLGPGSLPSLLTIDVRDNLFGPVGAKALASALRRGSMSKLVALALSCNPIGNQGLAALAAPLRRLPALDELQLTGCEIGDKGVASLVADLGKDDFKALKVVDLSNNELTDIGCATLTKAVVAGPLPSIRSVWLRDDDSRGNPEASEAAVHSLQAALKARGCNYSHETYQYPNN